MTKELSTRQACLIIFVAILSTKLLSLNSIISFDMSNNAWFVFFISFVIESRNAELAMVIKIRNKSIFYRDKAFQGNDAPQADFDIDNLIAEALHPLAADPA